jgi:hypothetical protein
LIITQHFLPSLTDLKIFAKNTPKLLLLSKNHAQLNEKNLVEKFRIILVLKYSQFRHVYEALRKILLIYLNIFKLMITHAL